MMHTPDRENDPWDTAMPAEIRQDLVDYAQPPAATRPTPDAGLLQQLPSTFGEIFDHLYDTAYNPREWQMPPILAEIMGVLTDPAVYVPDSRGRRVLDEYKATEAIHELIESRTLMQPTKWWRVMGADSHLWAETSSECEARSKMRPGDHLYRQWETVRRTEWREETP